MRFEQLEYLIEISRHKSLNAASHTLNLSPQALSMSMKNLEEELGFKLLQRSYIGTTLTPQAILLQEKTLEFIKCINEIRSNYQQDIPEDSIFPILVPSGLCEQYMPGFCSYINKTNPNIKIVINEAPYEEIVNLIANEKGNIGIYSKLYINKENTFINIPNNIQFTPFSENEYYCLAHENHPLAKYKSISLKTFLQYPIIAYKPGKYLIEQFADYCNIKLKDIKIIWYNSGTAISQLIENNVGVALNVCHNNQFQWNFENTRTVSIKEHVISKVGSIHKQDSLDFSNTYILNQLHSYFLHG
jgi:Transcriptional regulator